MMALRPDDYKPELHPLLRQFHSFGLKFNEHHGVQLKVPSKWRALFLDRQTETFNLNSKLKET